MKPDQSRAWKALGRLATKRLQRPPAEAVELDFQAAGLLLDLSKQHLDRKILESLLELAREANLADQVGRLFRGEHVNTTEDRPALHTALRATPDDLPEVATDAPAELERMLALAEDVRQGRRRGHTGKAVTDVVHIGIGGSHLGPELAVEALSQPWLSGPRLHFVANIDPAALDRALAGLDPERTLFVVVSKSFSTLETRINALAARAWLVERSASTTAVADQFIAVSANVTAATEFGLKPEQVLAMWDWVGGRYSVWSTVGLPVALAIGADGFREFLSGAREMDAHFASAPLAENLPVLQALTGIWNYNFLGVGNQLVLPYAERLRLLPDYLQQLAMESNGKSVHTDGTPVSVHTMPVLWGGTGTNGQHAFHQLLHQGTRSFAADFIVVANAPGPPAQRRWLLANALAQSQAMQLGHEDDDPHKRIPGRHATSTIVLERLDPATLGALLAFYEHTVFCQGVMWDINSFDQWGVELGKRLALPINEQLAGKSALGQDRATRLLIEHLQRTLKT